MDDPYEALISEVRALLEARRGDWLNIASADGAGVSYSWLSKFYNEKIPNPGYAKLKRLRDHLRPRIAQEAT